jgi:hypothetical protein
LRPSLFWSRLSKPFFCFFVVSTLLIPLLYQEPPVLSLRKMRSALGNEEALTLFLLISLTPTTEEGGWFLQRISSALACVGAASSSTTGVRHGSFAFLLDQSVILIRRILDNLPSSSAILSITALFCLRATYHVGFSRWEQQNHQKTSALCYSCL